MAAPDLNKRIKILSVNYTSDGLGGFTSSTSSVDVWAHVKQSGGSFNAQFNAAESQAKFNFTVRKRPLNVINTSKLVEYQSVVYHILYIDSGEFKNDYITLVCEQKNQ